MASTDIPMAAEWLVPEGDSTASSKAAAAVEALMLQLLSGTCGSRGANYSSSGSTGGRGESIHSRSESGAGSGSATASLAMLISPEELTDLQNMADR
jgi:hypothetical protein